MSRFWNRVARRVSLLCSCIGLVERVRTAGWRAAMRRNAVAGATECSNHASTATRALRELHTAVVASNRCCRGYEQRPGSEQMLAESDVCMSRVLAAVIVV